MIGPICEKLTKKYSTEIYARQNLRYFKRNYGNIVIFYIYTLFTSIYDFTMVAKTTPMIRNN